MTVTELHRPGQGKDQVDQRERERRAEADRIRVPLGADDDQPQ